MGPTGVGKTALAMALAERFRGEVISADSRQVYRQMDIGTGKPSAEEQRLAPHHLLDLLDPSESFDLATFLALAHAAIDEVNGRGGLPLVTGGTGQYIWALYEGWQVPPAAPDAEFRRSKQLEADRIGPQALHQELAAADPVRAAQIDRGTSGGSSGPWKSSISPNASLPNLEVAPKGYRMRRCWG